MDNKILQFRSFSASQPSKKRALESSVDLFSHQKRFAKKFVFLNIENHTQESLQRIIVRNSVQVIVDLRILPVFRSPQFDHKEVCDFIIARGIKFFDFSDLTQNILSSPSFVPSSYKMKLERLKSLLKVMKEGLCLIIFDENINDQQILPYVREIISDQHSSHTELNPKSLNR